MMNDLPEEMLVKIFSKLHHSDLQCVRLGNKGFYNASLAPSIINQEKLFYNGEVQEFNDFMDAFQKCDRNFYHFHFINAAITTEFEQLIESQGEFVRTFELTSCKVFDHRHFWQCLGRCENLESLILHECGNSYVLINTLFGYNNNNNSSMKGNHQPAVHPACLWPRLEYFYAEPFGETSEILNTFNTTMPNVKNIFINDNRLKFGFTDYIINFIGTLVDRLRCIELSFTFGRDEMLIKIADLDFRDLNEIRLHISKNVITDEGIEYFVRKQRTLKTVRIYNGACITDRSLFAIAGCLNDTLKTLHIEHCRGITWHGINRVLTSTPVRYAYIIGCGTSPDGTITGGGGGGDSFDIDHCSNLTELNLHFTQLKCTELDYIVRKFQGLTHLNLSHSSVTDDQLQLICHYQTNLRVLNLTKCFCITDDGFKKDRDNSASSSGGYLKNLEELYLNGCNGISDVTVIVHLKLPTLRALSLGVCEKLTANIFSVLPTNFPSLEALDITRIPYVDSVLIDTVVSMKRLRKLICDGTDNSENLLEPLYENTQFLYQLQFSCDLFTRSIEKKQFILTGSRVRMIGMDPWNQELDMRWKCK